MADLRQAAQQALEALEHSQATEPMWKTPIREAITALRTALEQPQQEPVAWMDRHGDVFQKMPRPAHWPPYTPLYPAPQPAREWVGLTDGEIVEALKASDKVPVDEDGWIWKQRIKWSRAIEAKLREKNAPQPADPDQVAELEQEARLMRARMERLEGERDELMQVMGLIASEACQGMPDMMQCMARAAIAKVEGRV